MLFHNVISSTPKSKFLVSTINAYSRSELILDKEYLTRGNTYFAFHYHQPINSALLGYKNKTQTSTSLARRRLVDMGITFHCDGHNYIKKFYPLIHNTILRTKNT